MGICAPTTTTTAGTSTSIPAASTRCSGSTGSRTPTRLASPATPGHHRPRDGGHRHREGGHQRLPAADPRLLHPVARVPPRGCPDLYPEPLRPEIDEINRRVYAEVNNGVYRCGFAGTQEAYEEAYERLWDALGWLTGLLRTERYLVGSPSPRPTCGCSRRSSASTRSTTATSSATATSSVSCRSCGPTPGTSTRRRASATRSTSPHIKAHYYVVHEDINPTGVIPGGPDLSGWLLPHGREALGGRPSATAPRPDRRRSRSGSRRSTSRRRNAPARSRAGPQQQVRS